MLKSRTGGFEKVVQMVDGMIANHAKDQAEDDAKTESEEKALKGAVADAEADIAEREDGVATLKGEIEGLKQGLAALDKSVAEATEQRKEEHAEYTTTAASNSAAVELI